MGNDLEHALEEALAERCIELEAMDDDQIRIEFAKQFGELRDRTPASRFDMIERLLEKLQQEL